MHYFDVPILVGSIDVDFVQREPTSVKGVQAGLCLLDVVLQRAHIFSLIDLDRKWGRFANNDAPNSIQHGGGEGQVLLRVHELGNYVRCTGWMSRRWARVLETALSSKSLSGARAGVAKPSGSLKSNCKRWPQRWDECFSIEDGRMSPKTTSPYIEARRCPILAGFLEVTDQVV